MQKILQWKYWAFSIWFCHNTQKSLLLCALPFFISSLSQNDQTARRCLPFDFYRRQRQKTTNYKYNSQILQTEPFPPVAAIMPPYLWRGFNTSFLSRNIGGNCLFLTNLFDWRRVAAARCSSINCKLQQVLFLWLAELHSWNFRRRYF